MVTGFFLGAAVAFLALGVVLRFVAAGFMGVALRFVAVVFLCTALALVVAFALGAVTFLVTFAALLGGVFLSFFAFFSSTSFFAVDFFLEVDLIKLSFPIKNPFEIACKLAYKTFETKYTYKVSSWFCKHFF